MKKFLYLLMMLASAAGVSAQTGVGVVMLTDAAYQFPETTVDSTSTFTLQIVNQLGTSQTLYFGVLEAPFSWADNGPAVVQSADTIEVTLNFNPTSVGSYSASAEVLGSIFGSATLELSGDGIQVVLDWTPESLVFDTTAIGQTNSQVLSITSSGDGDGVISAIEFSNPVFSVDSAGSSFTIAEGATNDLTFVFAPTGAGPQSGTATLHTNDPSNPEIVIDLSGTGISEVSGDICDMVWTAENSPYTLVGDVVVPEGCTLTIEPGTEVIGNDFDIEVFGSFYANGEEGNEVVMSCGELISHTAKEQLVLTHADIVETNSFEFFDTHFRILPDACDSLYGNLDSLPSFLDFVDVFENLYENENAASHFGKYSEDFSDGLAQGWSRDGNWDGAGPVTNGQYRVYYNGSNGIYYSSNLYSPTFTLNEAESWSEVSFDQYTSFETTGYTNYNRTYLRIDGGDWIEIDYESQVSGWRAQTYDLSAYSGSTIQFKSYFYWQDYGEQIIDNFVLTTNFYPGLDVSVSAAAVAAATLSTGGIELHNTTYVGDFHSVNDSLSVVLDNSSIGVNSSREKDSHGLGLYADYVEMASSELAVSGHALDGIHIESDLTDWTSTETSVMDNGTDGISVNGDLNWMSTEDIIDGNGQDGVDVGGNSNLTMYGPEIWNNGARGLAAANGSVIDLDYARIDGNGSHGVDLENTGTLNMDNCRLLNNGGQGIQSGSPTTLNHCNLAFNGGTGLVLTGNNFHTLNNSILWGNNETNYTQIDIGGGVISTSYSTVQGQSGYGVTGNGQFYWGEGVIEADPLFADDDLHLNTYSPCVDGGQPWLLDAHMPYGLGGVRADMGMYGGPDNAYWGGLALPDGASTLLSVQDSPQDQGNQVGLTFSASFYDNSELVNNVTHYSFWRHFDPAGGYIDEVGEGNWELLGEMPSLSLNQYAYQAPTLGNSNAFGLFNSCYFVAAHTADDDTYWVSNVSCGESVDNLAPNEPELNGLVLGTGEAQLFWSAPEEEDYAYTEIFSDAGFSATISTDTLVLDASISGTVTYTALHYDVNGNASESSSLTLDVAPGFDLIPLKAGWNLISTDVSPANPSVDAIFSSLAPGNLEYVTGFDAGVQFYDPDGLSFLNSLSAFDDGRGYWVRVVEADTLQVAGSALPANFLPALGNGWNLVGYPNASDIAPATYFADLIEAGQLEYVTGFDAGASYFDPNGLSFLNTLNAMQNGFGYWVKVAVSDEPNGAVLEPTGAVSRANPNFMLVNGVSDLASAAGESVQIRNAHNLLIAHLPILEGGYLMTTALFGDDPHTASFEGCLPGDVLHFEWNGRRAQETLTFEGNMNFKQISLTFNEPSEFAVFPNPFIETLTVSGSVESDAQVAVQLTDATGRVVAEIQTPRTVEGAWTLELPTPELPDGIYNCSVQVEGQPAYIQQVVRQ